MYIKFYSIMIGIVLPYYNGTFFTAHARKLFQDVPYPPPPPFYLEVSTLELIRQNPNLHYIWQCTSRLNSPEVLI